MADYRSGGADRESRMETGRRTEFGRRRADNPIRPGAASPEPTRKRGALSAPMALTLTVASVGAAAYIALAPSGPSCEERKRQNPSETCAASRTSLFLFLPFGSTAQAPAATSPRPTAAGLRPAIPDIVPARSVPGPGLSVASPAAPAAVSRGGFGASAGSFFSGGG
jgi:hypothetical protein